MTLNDLEFKGIDFQEIYAAVGIKLGTDLTPLADHCNRLLRERLEKAPVVFGREPKDAVMWGWQPHEKDTHTARLVCVEEVK